MVMPVNDFDVRLQAESPRTLAPRGGIILSATTNTILVGADGTGSPAIITLVATPLVLTGAVVFTTSPSVPLTLDTTGLIATLHFSDMGASSVVVTATLTSNGLAYADSRTISQATIGSLGYTGALDATRNNTAQGLLSGRPAGANGDFYFATDTLTLYQKVSGVWQTAGNNFTNTSQLTDGANLGGTATWGGVWGPGKASDNASADVILIGRNASVVGNTATKTGGAAAWDADAYSADSFTGGAFASAVVTSVSSSLMFGLNSDPTTDSTYTGLDYAIYLTGGTLSVYESGTAVGSFGTYTTADVFAVVYDGSSVRYMKNGTVFCTSTSPGSKVPNQTLFFDSSLNSVGSSLKNIRFGPLTSNNWASIGGTNKPQDNATVGANATNLMVTLGGDNLMNNSSFDVQTTAVTNQPNGYNVYNNAGVSTSFLPASGRLGGKAFAIKANAVGATNWGLTTNTSIVAEDGTVGGVTGGWQPGKTYVLSFKAHKVNGAGWASIGLRWNTGPTTVVEISNPAISTAWQTYSFRITWGASVEPSGAIFIDRNGSTAVNDELHIDELIIQEGDVYSEWFPSPRDALTAIAVISSDSMLSKGEKSTVIKDWNAIDLEYGPLVAQADSLAVDRTAYASAKSALSAYLLSLSPAYDDVTQDSAIVAATFRSKWTDYYSAKQGVLNALAAKAATLSSWTGVSGAGKPADNATVGAIIGTNLGGQITSGTASTFIADHALGSVQISDLRTSNYAEDGSGNPTAGAKLASAGTALKVANNSFQVGTYVFSDYWYRLIQGIDGNIANGRVIWRGNNDATTRGGAPNIACLSVTPSNSYSVQFDSSNGIQLAFHKYTITPTSYSTNTDNLDAIQQIHIQFFAASTSTAPFTEFYQACPSRTYDGASGISKGNWFWGWSYITPAADGRPDILLVGSGATFVYSGYLRVRLANTYGWSATQDFSPGVNMTTALTTTTITGVAGTSGGGSGSQGGACPAPWVKVRLLNGKEIGAGDLHNGARLAAVNDSTMQALPQGGVVRDLAVIWAQRYRVKLTSGEATEWSENHRFAVVDRGWVSVQNLRGGDQILGLKESVVDTVLAVGEGRVVSFRVEGAGTYFAGGLLCHNTKTL